MCISVSQLVRNIIAVFTGKAVCTDIAISTGMVVHTRFRHWDVINSVYESGVEGRMRTHISKLVFLKQRCTSDDVQTSKANEY